MGAKIEGAVLFDLDGTLVDSAPDLLTAAFHALRSNGVLNGKKLPKSDTNLSRYAGYGGRHLLLQLLSELGLADFPPDRFDVVYASFLDYYTSNIDKHTVCYSGIKEVLSALKSRNYGLGLCTNKTESMSRKLLFRLGLFDYFDIIIGGDTLFAPKPDPICITTCGDFFGLPHSRLVMIGDSYKDMLAAYSAGAGRIAVSYGYCYEDFSKYNIFASLSKASDITSAVDRYFASLS